MSQENKQKSQIFTTYLVLEKFKKKRKCEKKKIEKKNTHTKSKDKLKKKIKLTSYFTFKGFI